MLDLGSIGDVNCGGSPGHYSRPKSIRDQARLLWKVEKSSVKVSSVGWH